MALLRFLAAIVRRINDILAKIAMAIGMAVISFAALALFAQVVERHVTGQGYAWMNDFPPYLIPWCVFPLMGVLLRTDQHIKVEVAPNLLKGTALIALRLFIATVCLAAGVYFCWSGTQAVGFFILLGEVTETEIEIPFWYLYAAFPVGFGVLAIFAIERILEELLLLFGDKPPSESTAAGGTAEGSA
ncbi:MAG: TRAP transporter small permease subunit [Gammaproteobacteria bacterium]|nr:TRAP transporter small permease subunit [Gammaproteobacteria bacterium]